MERPVFTCVKCRFPNLPFDPQQSAGECPECHQEYELQADPSRVSKRALKMIIAVRYELEEGDYTLFFDGAENLGGVGVLSDEKELSKAKKIARTTIVHDLAASNDDKRQSAGSIAKEVQEAPHRV